MDPAPAEPSRRGRPRWPLSRGLTYMAAGAFSFSVMSALVKLVGARLPTMEVVLGRSVVTLALSGGTLALQGVDPLGRERGILLLRGVLGFLALSMFYYGVIHLPLADATVIQYTNPVFTALIAAAVLGEALGWRETALALASLAGVVLVAQPTFLFGRGGEALAPVAVLAALGGAVFSAASYVTVRRLKEERATVVVLWFAGVSTVGSLPFAVASWVPPTAAEWAILLAIGISTQVGQVLFTRGLGYEPAGRATVVGYLQIVFAAAWGALFFSEVLDGWTAVGALLVVASTFLLGREGR